MFAGLGVPELLLTAAIALLLWGVSRIGGATPESAARIAPPESAAARQYLDRLFGPALAPSKGGDEHVPSP